jgi:hypothetical protein
MRSALATAFWFCFLSICSLPWLSSSTGSSLDFGASLTSVTLTTLLAIVGLAIFVLGARVQRTPLLLHFVALVLLSKYWAPIDAGRLAIYIAVVIFTAIATEAVCQNFPLYTKLQESKQDVPKILLGSLKLWFPMIGFIVLGVWANLKIGEEAEEIVYDTLPVDEHCTIIRDEKQLKGAKRAEDRELSQAERFYELRERLREALQRPPDQPSPEIPCSRLGKTLQRSDVREIENRELAGRYVRDQFVRAKDRVVKQLENPSLPDPYALILLAQRIQAETWLYVVLDPNPPQNWFILGATASLAERKAYGDVQYQQLHTQVPFPPRPPALQQQMEARKEELAKQARKQLEEDEDLQNAEIRAALLHSLTANLNQISFNPAQPNPPPVLLANRPVIDVRDSKAVEAALADLRKAAFAELDRLEALASRDVIAFFFGEYRPLPSAFIVAFPESLHRKAIERIRNSRAAFASVFGKKPQCTTLLSTGILSREELKEYEDTGSVSTDKTQLVNKKWFDCPDEGDYGSELRRVDLETSIDRSLNFLADDSRSRADVEFQNLMLQAKKQGDEAVSAANKGLTLVRNDIDLGREKCRGGFMPISHCLANAAKVRAEAGYRDGVAKAKAKTLSKSITTTAATVETAEDHLVAQRSQMYLSAAFGKERLNNEVQKLFDIKYVIAALGWLGLSLAILKSYLYVVATEVFNKNQTLHIDIRPSQSSTYGSYETKDSVSISETFKPRLCTTRVGINQEQRTNPKQFFTSIVSRVLNSSYFLNCGSHAKPGHDMHFSAGEKKKIVEWRMKEGEEVIFSYSNFFGVSENVRLGTFVSLHLSTLLLGRYIFHTATCERGDGLLLLSIAGNSDSTKIHYAPLEQISAWNSHIQFHVNSDRSRRSVFIDGYIIGPSPSPDGQNAGLIVVNTGKNSKVGLSNFLRFVVTFLRPW